ncbi:MAG TPA: LysR family transcriptional regulator [Candidatus Saccharimonadales bacterium]|nr:LysR family transcriptional regulator [Candidatus Saccharimonadales bacterium]
MEERLHKFARLVDAGSFTKASAELHISQPALSVAIAKLERELQASLLVRGTRTLRLTEAGRLAYTAAKELSVTTSNLSTKLAQLAAHQPAISIGMIDSIADSLFTTATLLTNLEQQARVSVVVDNSRHLLQAVAHDDLDIAFIVEQPGILPSNIESRRVGTESLVAVCQAGQLETMQASIRKGVLPHFISYDQPSTTQRLIRKSLENRSITPQPAFYSTSPVVMLRLVLLSKGAAVLPYLLVKELLANHTLALLGQEQPCVINRPINCINNRSKEITAPLTQVIGNVEHRLVQIAEEVFK